jgi:hypothetical protein
MNRQWCCADFTTRVLPDHRGVGVGFRFASYAPALFFLLYRRPDSGPSDTPEMGGAIEFCPWCGRNLKDWFESQTP